MARIRVVIGEREAAFRTVLNDASSIERAAGLAATGAAVGGVFGGVGSGVGAALGGVAGLVGIGAPKRRTVGHLLRVIFSDALTAKAPNRVQRAYPGAGHNADSDAVTLRGEYDPAAMRKLVNEIFQSVISQLRPGTDEFGDITNAFKSLRFTKSSGGVSILLFNEAKYHGGSSGHVSDGVGDSVNGRTHDGGISGGNGGSIGNGQRSNEPRRIAEPGLVFGLSPVAIGAAIIGFLFLRS